jgi:hypothetical protein
MLRVDTKTQSMTAQPDDPINTQISFQGNGQEEVIYCGVWLDINDINNKRFPHDPVSDPGGVNGPYQNPLPLTEAGTAHRLFEEPHAKLNGKIVLIP